ncbi:hypothetical protein [Desulfitobacterium sp.]|uniref:hypothetical protein n=1 Tax=Desulfitobacterium sp. TaxID=49981 RepID=UPI002C97DF16|nr:hypothetical protein [Desulfitobacterium sp.]HVJ48055.1 hypothetical protein [Desulfitobacterium sp.]
MDNNEPSLGTEKLNTDEMETTHDSLGTTPETVDFECLKIDPEVVSPDLEDANAVSDTKSNVSGTPPNSPRRKKRWLKRLILFFCILAFGAIGLTQSPSASIVCQGCHEMKPEIATWQASSHSKIACIQCHQEINAAHLVQLIHFTKKYYLPIQVKEPVPNSICENCHSENRTVTPRGDLTVPHQKHETEGIACTTCHIGVAHGGIAERQETIDGDFSRWTDVTGRQNMAWQYKTMSMTECLNCHKDRNGPQDCKSCHSRIIPPPSHQPKEWVQNGLHGQEAFKNLDSCNECHSYSMNLVRVQNNDKVISYARSNSFCVECHSKKPESHTFQPFLHGARATQDQRGCLVCHEKTTTKKANVATKTICISCHKQQHSLPRFHPVPIQQGVGPVASCYKCHSQSKCSKCHK